MTLPKIIHRIWLDDPMPPLFEGWGRRWCELHPEWDVIEWRDSSKLPPLRMGALFRRARLIFPKDWKRFRADLLRLELLWAFGGVYVDTDVEPLRALDDFLGRGLLVAWSPNRGRGGVRLLTQAVMGAAAEHPFVDYCIRSVPHALQRHAGKPLAQVVGPHHVTRAWMASSASEHYDTPLDERYFYPQSIAERDRGELPDLGHAYAHHHWNTTLRKQGKGLG